MLLDVAIDLDAEAEAIEAEMLIPSLRPRRTALSDALMTVADAECKAG
jgi:hypothetical protein